MSQEIAFASITELSSRLKAREISSEELVRSAIERTEALEPKLNSYITFLAERALRQAREADVQISRGEARSLLHGIPMSLKDLFDTAGIPTSAGAAFMKDYVPQRDAVVTERLSEAGAVLMGKANMNKFAGGESGDNPDFGKMRNPWNLDFSPGGSSGGSGAQVAAGMVAFSVGSDNGGSIRIPAALCGVVGLKPTHGRVSMEGMFPRAYTIDHPGPITRTVEDCAIVLQTIAGHRPGDTTTVRKPVPDYREALREPIRGRRIGVDRSYVSVGQPWVLTAFEAALGKLEELGAQVQEVSLPPVEQVNEVMNILFYPEWGAVHEPWLRERPEEYFPGARAALLIPAVEYIKASRKRRLLQVEFARATSNVDLVASPTYPLDRRPFGDYPEVQGKPFTFDDALRYTMPFDVLGLPAISVPSGISQEGFPMALQLVGRAFDESTVLGVAYVYEQATEWRRLRPPV